MVDSKWESIEVGKNQPQPLVTFTLNKTIRFNKALMEKYDLHMQEFVKVLFKEQEDKIKMGFIFLDEKEDNTLKLSSLEGGVGFISAHKIFRIIGIEKEQLRSMRVKRRFIPYTEDYKDDKILVIDIPIKKEGDGDGRPE